MSSSGLNASVGGVLNSIVGVSKYGFSAGMGYNISKTKININFMKDEKDKILLNLGLSYVFHK